MKERDAVEDGPLLQEAAGLIGAHGGLVETLREIYSAGEGMPTSEAHPVLSCISRSSNRQFEPQKTFASANRSKQNA
jgi:hypothetical protein